HFLWPSSHLLIINFMHLNPIIDCIPNFSEVQNMETLQAIAKAIKAIDGVKLMHIDQGKAANRTVFTFAGVTEKVIEAAYQAIKVASELIDMRQQKGEHPRIGATDVCPLVPIANISMEEVQQLAEQLAERVGQLNIPVYLYEHSAKTPQRKNLATIRSGEYEGLADKMQLPEWQPDYGKNFNAETGATVIGARDFLIAYNVNLNTDSVAIANKIAREVRTSGQLIKNGKGEKIRVAGKCQALKAIGWYIEEYGKAQVSMNLINYQLTGIHEAYEACKMAAEKYQVKVTGSELIGLIPLSAILAAGRFYLQREGGPTDQSEQIIIETAVRHLGLAELAPFHYEERIIEYLL
ncbi:MAG: glutamate formimidoyltransferase, partial [Bacteroidota bacterium]